MREEGVEFGCFDRREKKGQESREQMYTERFVPEEKKPIFYKDPECTTQSRLRVSGLLLLNTTPSASAHLWSCNSYSQLANAFVMQADCPSSLSPDLHVHIMQWRRLSTTVTGSGRPFLPTAPNADPACSSTLRCCMSSTASGSVTTRTPSIISTASTKPRLLTLTKCTTQPLLDELTSLSNTLSRSHLPSSERSALSASARHSQLQHRLNAFSPSSTSLEPAYFGNIDRHWTEKLLLSPSPIDGQWLPKSAIYALVHLMVVKGAL